MKPKDVFRLILLASVWGSSYLFIKIIAPVIGIIPTMAVRVIVAALFLLLAAAMGRQLPPFKKYGWKYILLGAFNLVIPNILVIFSVMRLNASMASILNSTVPLFTLVIAGIWLKEKLSAIKIAGLILGMAGIIIVVGWNPIPLNGRTALAITSSLLAAICYGIANVFSKKHFSTSNPLQTAAGQLLGASLLVVPFLLKEPVPAIPDTNIVIAVAILAIVCTAWAFILFFKLISASGSVNTSLVTILVPVFGIIWSAIFLNEPITFGLVIGLIVIIAGLLLVLRPAAFQSLQWPQLFVHTWKKWKTSFEQPRKLQHTKVLCPPKKI